MSNLGISFARWHAWRSRAPTPREQLLVFVRHPEPGRVKSRLVTRYGEDGAAAICRASTELVTRHARALGATGVRVTVLVDPAPRVAEVARWLGPGLEYAAQADGDLGARFEAGFDVAFDCGATRVVAVGMDCPDAGPDLMRRAFDALADHDAVLGPSVDGGYYLLGLSRRLPSVFHGVPWSSPLTASVTRQRLADAEFETLVLEPLHDLDQPADVVRAGPRWPEIAHAAVRHETRRRRGASNGAPGDGDRE